MASRLRICGMLGLVLGIWFPPIGIAAAKDNLTRSHDRVADEDVLAGTRETF
jgi:hypothetical protein